MLLLTHYALRITYYAFPISWLTTNQRARLPPCPAAGRRPRTHQGGSPRTPIWWRSLDGGRTWGPPVAVAKDAVHLYGEGAYVPLADGTLVCVLAASSVTPCTVTLPRRCGSPCWDCPRPAKSPVSRWERARVRAPLVNTVRSWRWTTPTRATGTARPPSSPARCGSRRMRATHPDQPPWHISPPGPLSDAEGGMAATAWQYPELLRVPDR